MEIRIFQKGFNYSQDGAGNRLVFHLQGCNMRCPWCSNPEGMPPGGALMTEKEYLADWCCPKGAVSGGALDRRACEKCDDRPCAANRRQKGIRLSYQTYDIEDVARECVSSKPMFFDGGGVTLTGGEIGLQFEAVKALLIRLGEEGVHRAIESNGSHPRMAELIPHVDQWIMDVKHYDDEVHRAWTGVSNAQTIRTMKAVAESHPNALIRAPLIPGFNDSPADAEGFAALFAESLSGTAAKVEFLIYHEFGKAKWAQCGLEYRMKPGRIQPGTRERFEAALKERGVATVRT